MAEPRNLAAGQYQADLEIDLANEDENGLLWTWLDHARDESIVVPGAVLVLRDGDDVALGQVVELERLEQGTVVRVSLLPGAVEDYHAAVERAVRRSA
jgi:hypothetical protein